MPTSGTAAAPSAPPRVLVVDDRADTARLLQLLLEHQGYAVEAVTSAADALARARAWRPSAVVLDLELGGESGYALARALRAEAAGGERRLVAYSGRGGEAIAARCREAGCDHHVLKSADLEPLLAVLPPLDPTP